jgi:hypothetical protein
MSSSMLECAMKKLVLVITALLLNGCVFSDVRLPGPVISDARYSFTSEDFTVLGSVEAEGTITTILGIVQTGGNGYNELYDKAKRMGGDELMNYVFEVQSYSVLTLVYNKATWKARATVVRFSDAVKGKDE